MENARQVVVLSAIVSLCALPALSQTVTIPLIETKEMLDPGNPNLMSGSHQGQAMKLLSENKPKEAEAEANIALERAQKTGNQQAVESCTFALAKVYRREERFDESLKLYNEVLDYYKSEPDSDWQQAMILNNIGELYRAQGKLDKAVEVLTEAKSKTNDKSPSYCAIPENLGYAYMKLGKTKEAEAELRAAMAAADDEHDRRSLADSSAALTLLVYKQSRVEETKQLLERALPAAESAYGPNAGTAVLLKKISNEINIVDDYKSAMSTGIAAMHANHFADGLAQFQKAQNAIESAGVHNGVNLLAALLWESTAYLAVEKFQQSKDTANRAIEIYNHSGLNQPEILDALEKTLKKIKEIEETRK